MCGVEPDRSYPDRGRYSESEGYSESGGYSDPGVYADADAYPESASSEGGGWPAEGRYASAHSRGEIRYSAGEGRYAAAESHYGAASGSPVPEARRAESREHTSRGTIGPRSGLPIPPPEDPPRRTSVPPVSPVPQATPVPPRVPPAPTGETYRSRRPAAMAVLGLAAVLLEIPPVLLLIDNISDGIPSAIVSSVCLILALPLLAMGLYAVATGAVRAAGPNSAQAWLRPPVAYLSVALVLFVAAGLAA